MKKLLITLAVFGISVVSCQKRQIDEPIHDFHQLSVNLTKMGESYFVTQEDVCKYIDSRLSEKTVRSIEPFKTESGELTSYVVNYSNGWEIIAADKRGPVVLADADEGNFVFENLPPAAQLWLNGLNEEISCFRKQQGTKATSQEEGEGNEYFAFWESLTADTVLFRDRPPLHYPGHWVLVDTQCNDHYDCVVQHLVSTHWGQYEPYNSYCPIIAPASPFDTIRAAAGCVAIAGAQLLNYFHSFFGTPYVAPTSCTTVGYVYNFGVPVMQYFDNYSPSAWDNMEHSADTAAVLVAYTGNRVHTNYGYQQSNAYIDDFAYFIRDSLGIECYSKDYIDQDTTYVISNLNDGIPVLASAKSNSERHAFIIDSWWVKRHRHVNTYEFEFFNPEEVPDDYYNPPRVEIVYSVPLARLFSMNWGWNGNYDNAHFLAAGSWHPGGVSYNQERVIYYNFNCL